MTEYIERSKEFIQGAIDLCNPRTVTAIKIKGYLEEQPAADVAPVVRCKDCKHLMFSDCYGECSQAHLGIVRPDDFCSYGERREPMPEHIYQRSIDCALRHITVARDNFEFHYAHEFDIDWAMEQFNRALDILENLKEYKVPAWEEENNV